MKNSLNKLALFAVAMTLVSSVAQAAPSSWDMPSGDHGSYTYSGGQSATGNIGSGTSFSSGFFFIPPSLKATTTDVGHASASDTVSVILNAKPNTSFSHIGSNLLGDYTIFGAGSVNSTGELRVTNLDTSTTLTSPLAFGGTVPTATLTNADGVFQGLGGLDLPKGWTNIKVEMDGMVAADTASGSALIQGKDAEISVTTAQVPIPAALAVAPVAAFFGWRAKRKLVAAR